jgi:hypothetical protein
VPAPGKLSVSSFFGVYYSINIVFSLCPAIGIFMEEKSPDYTGDKNRWPFLADVL